MEYIETPPLLPNEEAIKNNMKDILEGYVNGRAIVEHELYEDEPIGK